MFKPSVFFDANVIISGCHSTIGGSALLLQLATENKINVVISKLVLIESEKNLIKKFSKGDLLKFYQWLGKTKIKVVRRSPTDVEITKYSNFTGLKDAHVLASAIDANVEFLITRNRKHFMNQKIKKVKLPLIICTPAEFLQKYLLKQTN